MAIAPPPSTPEAASPNPARPWYRPPLRRVRTLCVAAAVVLFAMLAVSSRYDLRAWYNQRGSSNSYELGLSGGSLVVYWTSEAFHPGSSLGPGFSTVVEKRWDDAVSLAWRPYHMGLRRGFNAGDTHHGLVFPLWLLAVPATIAAAYTQGHLAGFRRGDKGHCAKCGYSRAGIADGAPCPECGAAVRT